MGDNGDSGPFPASEQVQGQKESRTAYQLFMTVRHNYKWAEEYAYISATYGFTNWRQIAFVAWASSPYDNRQPPTQAEFAKQILGLSTDQIISRWRKKDPRIDLAIFDLQASPLMRYRRDAFDALALSATNPAYQHAPDRRTFFTMTRDLTERSEIDQTTRHSVDEALAKMIDKVYSEDEDDEPTK